MMRNCALPKDPYYPVDLEKLGYFINDIDEIRWIDHPSWYFKYFITKNERHNIRHREAFNTAVRSIIYSRLEQIGMRRYLCSDNKVEWESPELKKRNSDPDTAVPHIPIYASKNVGTSPRVVVLFGESFQDLGILSNRIIDMESGINAGSVISFIQRINATKIDSLTGVPLSYSRTTSMKPKMEDTEESDLLNGDTEAPAIILANTGQLRWCRSLGKAITFTSWNALTRRSAVDECVHYEPLRNSVQGHKDISSHVDQILTTVIPKLCGANAKVEILAIADSCEYVPISLDRNWSAIESRMQSIALINPELCQPESYTNPRFITFLLQRTRGYVKDSIVPANTPMFGPMGGNEKWQKGLGYNVYSIPDESADESIFPRHFINVLEWQGKVACHKYYAEDELKLTTAGENADASVADIDTKVKTHAEIEAEIKSGNEQGLLSSDLWDMSDGVDESTKKEDEIVVANRTFAHSSPIEQYDRKEDEVNKRQDEGLATEIGGVGAGISIATSPHIQTKTYASPSNNDSIFESLQDDTITEKKRDLSPLTIKPLDQEDVKPATGAMKEVNEDTEPTASAEPKKSIFDLQGFGYHKMSREDKELGFKRFKWLTDEEAAEAEWGLADAEKTRKTSQAEEKKARANRLDKAERRALLNAQIEPRKLQVFKEEMSAERAELPPTVDDALEICSNTSMEKATQSLIADTKVPDIASHTTLPTKLPTEENEILRFVKVTTINEISDIEEEVARCPPKLEKDVSFQDGAPCKTSETGGGNIHAFDGVSDGDILPTILRRVAPPTISFNTIMAKKMAAEDGRRFQASLKGTVVAPPANPRTLHCAKGLPSSPSSSYQKIIGSDIHKQSFSFGGDGATDEDAYLSCPPERMERLPDAIAKTLHKGMPEVKLNKDEKAAILQTTVLSSPVKEKNVKEGDENRKISVATLDN